jgi:signal transduction histidine kinase
LIFVAKAWEKFMAELAKPDNYLDSQAKQVLRQLVAEMSNEMRTQIARILAYSQVMLEPEEVGTLNEEQRKYLTTIYQAGQNLLKILDDSVDNCILQLVAYIWKLQKLI